MEKMMSKADALRKALKAAGYNARRVTVRHDHYSMGSTLYVTVRDASVPISVVKEIAKSFERIDRDGFGEILAGANTYLNVDYGDEILIAAREEIRNRVAAAPASEWFELAPGVRALRDIVGSRYGSTACYEVGEGDDARTFNCFDADSLVNAADYVIEARALAASGRRAVYASSATIEAEAPAAETASEAPSAHLAMLASMGVV